MLLVDDKEVVVVAEGSVVAAATTNARVREANALFLSRRADPSLWQRGAPSKKKVIHVLQNEMASVEYEVDDAVIASDDATTCVIVVVVCQATGVASIAHLDEQSSKSDVCFRKLMSQHVGGRHCSYDAYVVGGMMEDTLVGFRTSENLLTHMSRSPGRFSLRLCCVYDQNTCGRTGQPLARSFAFDPLTQMTYHVSACDFAASGSAAMAAQVPLGGPGAAAAALERGKGKRSAGFASQASCKVVSAREMASGDSGAVSSPGQRDQRGPGLEQRLAHYWLNDHGEGFTDLVNVYDTWDQKFILTGRIYTVPKWLMVNYSYLLTLSSTELLEKTSTTPRFEGKNFCSDVRLALGFILRQQEVFTLHTRSFNWDPIGGIWMEVTSDKKLKPGRERAHAHLAYHEEPKVDIPGSSWSYTSLVDLEKEHLAAQAK